MKKLIPFIIAALMLPLFGCAGPPVQITEQMVDSAGNIIGKTTKTISDASVGKEESVHVTLRNRDNQIAASAKAAGMKMKWVSVTERIEVPGQQPIVMTRSMPEVSYTPQAEFTQPLPTAPSEHPAWRTLDNLGGKAIDGSLIGYSVKQGAGVLKHAINKAGDTLVASGDGATVSKTTKSNQASGQDSTVNDNAASGEASGACAIASTHLSDCRTTTNGPATADEYNACLIKDYGYSSDVIASCPQ